MCPYAVVCNVYCWQYAPEAINLRVVSVDFGNDEEDRRDGNSEGKSRDKRIRSDIDMLESFWAQPSF